VTPARRCTRRRKASPCTTRPSVSVAASAWRPARTAAERRGQQPERRELQRDQLQHAGCADAAEVGRQDGADPGRHRLRRGNRPPRRRDAADAERLHRQRRDAVRKAGVVEKCTFCYHRTTNGMPPACVEVCPSKARIFGDQDDEKAPVAQLLKANRSFRLKEEAGTRPTCTTSTSTRARLSRAAWHPRGGPGPPLFFLDAQPRCRPTTSKRWLPAPTWRGCSRPASTSRGRSSPRSGCSSRWRRPPRASTRRWPRQRGGWARRSRRGCAGTAGRLHAAVRRPTGALAQPYGSVWLEDGSSLMSDSTVRSRAVRRRGIRTRRGFRDLPDHVAAELEFLYLLLFRRAEAGAKRRSGGRRALRADAAAIPRRTPRALGGAVCRGDPRRRADCVLSRPGRAGRVVRPHRGGAPLTRCDRPPPRPGAELPHRVRGCTRSAWRAVDVQPDTTPVWRPSPPARRCLASRRSRC